MPNSKSKSFRCRPAPGVVHMGGMALRLRLQYRGAMYHLLARGNGRQKIVREDLRLETGCNACTVTDPRRGGVDRKRLAPYGMHPRGGVNARLAAGGGVPLP
jgi:hypothetical protein